MSSILHPFIKNPKYSFTAWHCGGLKECLQTEKPITISFALRLINLDIYEFYAYDSRINCDRYILKDYPNSLGFPTWLHLYAVPPKR